MAGQKSSAPTNVDSQVTSLIDRKFSLMEQLQKVKMEIRQVDRQMMKVGGTRADVISIIQCW